MMRATYLLLAVWLRLPGGLEAQGDSGIRRYDATSYEPRPFNSYNVASYNVASHSLRRAVVHWGKWLFAGAAAAFTVMGAHEHENSNREWNRLLDICHANNDDCLLGAGGTYLNPTAEQLYQSSLHFDRRARTRLLAGQGALLVAAGMFITDLRRHSGGPENKPLGHLELSINERTGGARMGVRIGF